MLLKALKNKDDGCLVEAATKLTPFVQALSEGIDYVAKLRLESATENTVSSLNAAGLLELCEEDRGSCTGPNHILP